MSSTAVLGFIKDIIAKNTKAVQQRLKQKEKPDQRYVDPKQQGLSYTLLHKAVAVGSPEITAALLKAGADCNARDSRGRTCLHWLASCNTAAHLKIAELLLQQKGIDVHAVATDKTTALHEAAALGNQALAKLLIETAGARADDCAPGHSPLHAACRASSWASCAGVTSLLLQHSPQLLGQQDAGGFTPLMTLLRRGMWSDALQLMTLGDWNLEAKAAGESALMMAIGPVPVPCQQLVSGLLAAGAATDVQAESSGSTALMAAIKSGGEAGLQLAKLLVSTASDRQQAAPNQAGSLSINAVNAAGETALSLAMAAAATAAAPAAAPGGLQLMSSGEQLLGLVLQQKPDVPQPLAVELVKRGLCRKLSDATTTKVILLLDDVEEVSSAAGPKPGGLSFDSLLAAKLYRSAAAALIKTGCKTPGAPQDAAGNTHLHLAVAGPDGAPELVAALLAVGVPADAANKEGDTALHVAARAGHVQACRALVAGGADVLRRNGKNRPPAGQLKLPEVTKAFLQEAEDAAKAARQQRQHDLFDEKMRANHRAPWASGSLEKPSGVVRLLRHYPT